MILWPHFHHHPPLYFSITCHSSLFASQEVNDIKLLRQINIDLRIFIPYSELFFSLPSPFLRVQTILFEIFFFSYRILFFSILDSKPNKAMALANPLPPQRYGFGMIYYGIISNYGQGVRRPGIQHPTISEQLMNHLPRRYNHLIRLTYLYIPFLSFVPLALKLDPHEKVFSNYIHMYSSFPTPPNQDNSHWPSLASLPFLSHDLMMMISKSELGVWGRDFEKVRESVIPRSAAANKKGVLIY